MSLCALIPSARSQSPIHLLSDEIHIPQCIVLQGRVPLRHPVLFGTCKHNSSGERSAALGSFVITLSVGVVLELCWSCVEMMSQQRKEMEGREYSIPNGKVWETQYKAGTFACATLIFAYNFHDLILMIKYE